MRIRTKLVVCGVLVAGVLASAPAAEADAFVYGVSATYAGVADLALSIATDASEGRSYIASGNDNSVKVLDDSTGAVLASVPVGDFPSGVAIDSSTHTVWVPNYFDASVSVISEDTDTVIDTIPTGVTNNPFPSGIAIDALTSRAYVSNGNGTTSVINTNNHKLVATWGIGSSGIAVNQASDLVLVADFSANVVYFVDGATGAIENTVDVGSYPTGIAVDPGARRAYVANFESDSISVLNLASQSNVATIPTADSAAAVAVDPTTRVLYATAEGNSNTVSIYNESNLQQMTTLPVGSGPIDVSVDRNTHQAFVLNEFDNSVSVINSHLVRTPVVTTVSPDSGVAGSKLTITGSHFTAASSVRFGGALASDVSVRSSHRIVVSAPTHANGVVNVRVQTGGGTSAVVTTDQFTYCSC